METISALGQPCPLPVIAAKKALEKPESHGVVIRVDNKIAVENLEKMAKGMGFSNGFTYEAKANDCFEVTIAKNQSPIPDASAPQDLATPPPDGQGLVVMVSRSTFGDGDEGLGKMLMKSYVYALTELPTPPACIIFLNGGAFLTAKGSNALQDLQTLAEKGTAIYTCGACINHFGLTDGPAIGEVTNMYAIAEKTAAARSVIHI